MGGLGRQDTGAELWGLRGSCWGLGGWSWGVPAEEVEGLVRGGVGHPHGVGRSPRLSSPGELEVLPALFQALGSEPCTSKPRAPSAVCLTLVVASAGAVAGRVGPSLNPEGGVGAVLVL